jgi:hypothetical protein
MYKDVEIRQTKEWDLWYNTKLNSRRNSWKNFDENSLCFHSGRLRIDLQKSRNKPKKFVPEYTFYILRSSFEWNTQNSVGKSFFLAQPWITGGVEDSRGPWNTHVHDWLKTTMKNLHPHKDETQRVAKKFRRFYGSWLYIKFISERAQRCSLTFITYFTTTHNLKKKFLYNVFHSKLLLNI